jgi:4-amino-4-deoxy-L-arabinose transferase-like glycosyltransferase
MTTSLQIPVIRNQRRNQLFFLLAAIAVNAVMLFVAVPRIATFLSPRYGPEFGNHGDLYDLIANNLDEGIGYRVDAGMSETMMREPGYPLFLAGVFKIGGYRVETAQIANLLLVAGIAFMVMRLALRVTTDGTTAFIATLLFLIYPSILISETRAGVEIAFIFALMLFMLVLHGAVERGNRVFYFGAGLVLGIVVLVRSTPMFFPVFLLVYLLWIANGHTERFKVIANTAVLALGMVVTMSPWVIRNYLLVHQFVPSATVQGVAAQEGLYTCENLSFDTSFFLSQRAAAHQRNLIAGQLGVPFEGDYYQLFHTPQDEVVFNGILLHGVEAEYREDPTLLAQCAGENVLKFWFLGKTWQATWMNVVIQLPILILAGYGVGLLWKRGLVRNMGIILTFTIYIVAVHAPIIAHARHSIPLVPFLLIFASVSLVSIWLRLRGASSPLAV